MSDLDDRLLLAHNRGDAQDLSSLYTQAADQTADTDAKGFFLTHAYVFALEAGLPQAPALRRQLIAMGRETPL
ncbi:hypothetical protein [Roseobacter weihaiensis]|uniref:hypothetical protein n=1 Tax=Roseobacter weihaiensis TaxID=2763262 RepID=UPI001D09F67C|nr:hypothetical protein [Roseobacter sp. H9]